MKDKTLGNTGLLVSQLCLGTMTFSDGTGVYEHIGNVDQAGADQLVGASIEAGINFFDQRSGREEGRWILVAHGSATGGRKDPGYGTLTLARQNGVGPLPHQPGPRVSASTSSNKGELGQEEAVA